MSTYLVTVSWLDPNQPLRRLKETLTHTFEDISQLEGYDITRLIKESNRWASFRTEDIAIDFMMKIGD